MAVLINVLDEAENFCPSDRWEFTLAVSMVGMLDVGLGWGIKCLKEKPNL